MRDGSISIVLPVYNQADHIGAIVKEYVEGLARLKCDFELILVCNACRDASVQVCEEVAREQPCRVLVSEQGGWGRGVKLGLGAARGDLLCYTNSARTSAADLTLMLLYAVVYPDVVVKANRKIRESRRRRIGSLLYNIEVRTLFDLPVWDINGTPKVFPRKFGKLLDLTRDDDLIDAEFNIVCRREEYPVIEVPIFSARRHGGSSTTSYGAALHMYLGAIDMWRQGVGRR